MRKPPEVLCALCPSGRGDRRLAEDGSRNLLHILWKQKTATFFPLNVWGSVLAWLMPWELPRGLWSVLEYWQSFGLKNLDSIVKGLTESIQPINLATASHSNTPAPFKYLLSSQSGLRPEAGLGKMCEDDKPRGPTRSLIPFRLGGVRFSLLLLLALPKWDLESCSHRVSEETPESKVFNLKYPRPLLIRVTIVCWPDPDPGYGQVWTFFYLLLYQPRFWRALYLVVCIIKMILKNKFLNLKLSYNNGYVYIKVHWHEVRGLHLIPKAVENCLHSSE